MHVHAKSINLSWLFTSSSILCIDIYDCSVGEVKSQLSEDERLEVGGFYFLPEAVSCDGDIVSWHSCFFYNALSETNLFRI